MWTLRTDGIKVPKVEGVQASRATGGSKMNRIGSFTVALVISLAGALLPHPARAAYGDGGGAQYSCNSKRQLFTVLALDQFGVDSEAVKSGFAAWPIGKKNLICHLGGRTLNARITAVPPYEGQCGGYGYAHIDGFTVDGVELLGPGGVQFNFPCPGNTLVVSIRVHVRDHSVQLVGCAIPWDGDSMAWTENKLECTTKTFAIDSQANSP
jgi:hypothetical protein